MSTFADLHPARLVANPANREHTPEAIEEMAASIRSVGILQPLVVIPLPSFATDPNALAAIPIAPAGEAPGREGGTENTDDESESDEDPFDGNDGPIEESASSGSGLYRIVIGHRRHRGALEAGLASVPCQIVDTSDPSDQLIMMLTENIHRDDMSVLDEAAAYAQLALLNVEAEKIADALAVPQERVSTRLAISRLPGQVRSEAADALVQHGLNLEQLLAIEQFSDDPVVMGRLLRHANPASTWTFEHVLRDERARRAKRDRVEALRAQLVLDGVRVMKQPKDWFTGPYVRAKDLLDRDGTPLDPEQAKIRPGFAAYINADAEPYVVVFCLNPADWDYQIAGPTARTSRPSQDDDEEDDEARDDDTDSSDDASGVEPPGGANNPMTYQARREEAERRREQELAEREARKQAIEAAQEVRRKFLTQEYGNAKAAKKALPEAIRFAALHGYLLNLHGSEMELVRQLAGIPSTVKDLDKAIADAGMDRLTRILVAYWLTAMDENLTRAMADWSTHEVLVVDYLDRLLAGGYQLSDVEEREYNKIRKDLADKLPDESESEGDPGQSADSVDAVGGQKGPDESGDEQGDAAGPEASSSLMKDEAPSEQQVSDASLQAKVEHVSESA